MNYGGDAADQIVRYSLDGVDHGLRTKTVALRLSFLSLYIEVASTDWADMPTDNTVAIIEAMIVFLIIHIISQARSAPYLQIKLYAGCKYNN